MLNSKHIVPLYQQIENELRHQIETGELKPNQKLPSETALSAHFGVSTITAKKAILNLVDQGLLERKQGKGTFVLSSKHSRDLSRIVSFSETCRLNGSLPGSNTLQQQLVDMPLSIRQALGVSDTQAVFIHRLRYVDCVPMALEKNWFSKKYVFLLEENLEDKSLFELINKKSDARLFSARRSIEICYANSRESELLHVAKDAALLLIRSTVYNPKGVAVFYGEQVINADHFRVIV